MSVGAFHILSSNSFIQEQKFLGILNSSGQFPTNTMFYNLIKVFLTATLKFVLLLKCWFPAKDTSEGMYSISQKQSNPHYVDECRFEKKQKNK